MREEDLTAMARIRLAAIEVFAEAGFAHATVRVIAERAGVSPALIVHHYGSKAGLRQACDDYVIEFIVAEKKLALAGGPLPTVRDFLEAHPEMRPMYSYLKRVLVEGGPSGRTLFERMAADTRSYLDAGVEAGQIRPSVDPEAQAAILTAYSVGVLLLDSAVGGLLGGDSVMDDGIADRYASVTLELFTHGLLTGDLAAQADRHARAGSAGPDTSDPSTEESELP